MNAQTSLRRPSSSAILAAACIALSAVAPLAVYADPPTVHAATLESTVSLSDLDLSTSEGVRAAHKRLKRKAEHLCRQLWDDTSATFRWTYDACVKQTVANALQRLNVPRLAEMDR
jgi:UrcA family protein